MNRSVIKIRRRFKESNIFFQSESSRAITAGIDAVKLHREKLEKYILLHPKFLYTLKPISVEENDPHIVKIMAKAGKLVDVGPMAAVAGAIADLAVESMLYSEATIAIVENGGEVSASSKEKFVVGLYAGKNAFSRSHGFQIDPSECPIGIATSSATISHAFSFGEADAATIFADTSALADAAATAVCNAVQGKDIETSIQLGLEAAEKLGNLIRGVLIIRGKHVGIVGKLPLLMRISKGFEFKRASISEAIISDKIIF